MSRIPKVMHQLYFPDESTAPDDYRRYRAAAVTMHPDWEHRFWTEATARDFLRERYPDFLPVYDGYPYRIQRCDAIRYFLLHTFGGFYVDMDIEFIRPLDDLIGERELIFCDRACIGNAIMGSAPEHPLWPSVFEAMRERKDRPAFGLRGMLDWSQVYYVSRSTGSEMLQDCVVDGGYRDLSSVLITPGHVLEADGNYQVDAQKRPLPGLEDMYAIHHKGMRGVPLRLRVFSQVCCTVARSTQSVRGKVASALGKRS
jgi:inositol phosphorylceramide mannosyltransferase catalytic subunit